MNKVGYKICCKALQNIDNVTKVSVIGDNYKQSFMLYVVKSLIDEIKCQCAMISPISLIHKRLMAGR